MHRPALREQLARLRRLPALGVGDPRALRVRAGRHLARRARGPRAVDAGAGARRLSGQRPTSGRTACIGTFPRHAQTVRSAPLPPAHGRAERRLRGHGAAAVAHARAREQRPPRPGGPAVARARRHAALGRGPDGDRPLLPPRPQAARGQRQPHDVADGQVGHGRWSPSAPPSPGTVQVRATHLATPTAIQLVAKPVRVDVAALHAGPGARGPAVRLLQQRLAAKGYVVGQRGLFDQRTGARRARLPQGRPAWRARRSPTPALFKAVLAGKGTLQGAPPRARQARRGRPLAPGHRPHPGREGAAHLPGELGQAVDADDPGQLPGLLEDARASTPRACTTPTTSSAASRSTATPTVPVFAASHGCLRVPIPDAISIFRWIKIGDIVDVYP